jgi:hypothetical protein
MIQIGILVAAVALIITGIRALVGGEKPGKQTSRGTAIASLVIGFLLIGFALIGLPLLLAMM